MIDITFDRLTHITHLSTGKGPIMRSPNKKHIARQQVQKWLIPLGIKEIDTSSRIWSFEARVFYSQYILCNIIS